MDIVIEHTELGPINVEDYLKYLVSDVINLYHKIAIQVKEIDVNNVDFRLIFDVIIDCLELVTKINEGVNILKELVSIILPPIPTLPQRQIYLN